MRKVLFFAAAALVGCASSGVIQTDQNTYMVTKNGAGGVFSSGAAVQGDLYKEANDFCAAKGQVVETVSSEARNAIPFVRTNSAELKFKCVKAQ